MDQESVAILLPNEYWNNRSIKEITGRKPIIVLAIQTIFLIIYTIFTFVFDYIVDAKTNNPIINASHSSTVIYFSHLAIRLLCLVFKLYLDNYYHNKLKLYGYHKHHKSSTFLSEITHLLFNKITLLLLLNSTVFQVINTNNDDTIHVLGLAINQAQVAKIIAVVMSSIITIISGKKLHIEIDFQRKQNAPDTITDNEINDTRQPSNDVGLRLSNSYEELLEKQSDMIINLKMQNDHLRLLLMKAHESTDQAQSETTDQHVIS